MTAINMGNMGNMGNPENIPVSVVIPLYNKASYIHQTLLSVFMQTYRDFEVIVSDDGSTDGSAEIVESTGDSRVRILRSGNRGVSVARNAGIAYSCGELTAFLDADDVWKPVFLETIMRLHTKYPDAGIYATGFEILHQDGSVEIPAYVGLPDPPWEGLVPDYFHSMTGETPIWTSALAIPRRIFDEVGYFASGRQMGEDQDMWTRIAMHYPVAFSNTVCSVYRKGAVNSMCSKYRVTERLPVAVTVHKALKVGVIPSRYRYSASEYLAKLDLIWADGLISARHTLKALILLLNIRTKIFRKYRSRMLYSLLPVSFRKRFFDIRSVLSKYLKRRTL